MRPVIVNMAYTGTLDAETDR